MTKTPLISRLLENLPAYPWQSVLLPEEVFLWRTRYGQEVWISVGIAAEFDSLDAAQAALPKADSLPFVPRCAGVVAFDPTSESEELWHGFPRKRFWIPRVQLRWSADEVSGIEILGANGASANFRWPEVSNDRVPVRPKSERSNLSREQWRAAIAELQRQMSAGRLSKAVLSRRVEYDFESSCNSCFLTQELLNLDADAYLFVLRSATEKIFCGISPERLFRLEQRSLLVDSLAGSRPRGTDAAESARNRDELAASGKDHHEQQIVTDYVCEKLLPVSVSLAATDPVIRETGNLIHLLSEIRADLKQEISANEILELLHPTPAVCGVPAVLARDLITTLESDPRGLYAGAVGMATRDTAEFAVAIRSGVIEREKATLFAGAGIVAESDAEREYDECEWKLAGMKRALFGEA